MKLSGESIFFEYAKKLKESNLVLVVVLESKGLYHDLLVRCIKKANPEDWPLYFQ